MGIRGWLEVVVLGVPLICTTSCGDDGSSTSSDSGGQATGTGVDTTTVSGSGTSASSGATTESTTAGSDTSASGGETSGTSGTPGETTATGNNPNNPLDCGGTIWACGNGMDDDGDGKVDLDDPECTGPCDDDEGTFATGLPGDNVDCRQDCFFDGNSGQGDDGCLWDLRCDPENPGGDGMCAYRPGMNCNQSPPNQTQECIDYCAPLTPPGCDCFGCCTVLTDNGEVHIFLNSGGDCALDNLDACQSCTPNESCGPVDCQPEECELCFGQSPEDLPEGCGTPTCDNQLPCEATADCPTDFFCYLNCCYPPPPG